MATALWLGQKNLASGPTRYGLARSLASGAMQRAISEKRPIRRKK